MFPVPSETNACKIHRAKFKVIRIRVVSISFHVHCAGLYQMLGLFKGPFNKRKNPHKKTTPGEERQSGKWFPCECAVINRGHYRVNAASDSRSLKMKCDVRPRHRPLMKEPRLSCLRHPHAAELTSTRRSALVSSGSICSRADWLAVY